MPRGLRRAAWVEVDVDILRANALALIALVPTRCHFGVVVKADGYGHGAEMSARAAIFGGAKQLFVATLDEALQLRSCGITAPIMNLYPIPFDAAPEAAHAGIEVAIGEAADLVAIDRALARAPVAPRLRIHLEIETGLVRGGINPGQLDAAVKALREATRCDLVGVWSHLAAPEDPHRTSLQADRLREVVDRLAQHDIRPSVVHLSATAGLLHGAPTFDMVRVGLGMYGLIPPGVEAAQSLRPALSVKSRPVRVVAIPAGTGVGYAGTWIAERPSVVATLPLGYVDGWLRRSSPGGSALVRGVRTPIVGRISSDSMVVDVTDVPGVTADDEFVLIGEQAGRSITVDEVARQRETISWEVIQTLSGRLARVYTGETGVMGVRSPFASTVVPRPTVAATTTSHASGRR